MAPDYDSLSKISIKQREMNFVVNFDEFWYKKAGKTHRSLTE